MNSDTAITTMLALLNQAAAWGATVAQARSEGRDVSDAEVAALAAKDDAARTALEAAIKKRREG